jgi:CrcB protein
MYVSIVLVAIGSAIGGVARFLMQYWFAQWIGLSFPWGTLTVNVLGCFAIGVTYGLTEHAFSRHFIGVGILGGFTTFSSFSFEAMSLLQNDRPGAALGYIGLSVGLCLVMVYVGYLAALGIRQLIAHR